MVYLSLGSPHACPASSSSSSTVTLVKTVMKKNIRSDRGGDTKILLGIGPRETLASFGSLKSMLCPISPVGKYDVHDIVADIREIPTVSSTPSLRTPQKISRFEDFTFLHSGTPFESVESYLQWKTAVLSRVERAWDDWDDTPNNHNNNIRVIVVPYWVLFPEWFPAMLQAETEQNVIMIAPFSIENGPIVHYRYLFPETLSKHNL